MYNNGGVEQVDPTSCKSFSTLNDNMISKGFKEIKETFLSSGFIFQNVNNNHVYLTDFLQGLNEALNTGIAHTKDSISVNNNNSSSSSSNKLYVSCY